MKMKTLFCYFKKRRERKLRKELFFRQLGMCHQLSYEHMSKAIQFIETGVINERSDKK
nr:MAG TPA: hypothetical protein [Caudoviricetes sp.]